jgi:hypothetical protein
MLANVRHVISLRASDYEASLRLVAELARSDTLEQYRQHLLEGLAALVPFEIATYNEVNVDRGAADYVQEPADSIPPGLKPVFEELVHQHPLVSYFQRARDGSTRTISDFLSAPEFARLELYQQFFRPLRVNYQIAFTLPSRSPKVIGIESAGSWT